MSAEAPPKPKLVRRLEAKREVIKDKPRPLRWLLVAAGFTLLLAGAAMMVLPGPAFVVIPVGLALLSLEFCWAQRLLDRSLVEAERPSAGRRRRRGRSGCSPPAPSASRSPPAWAHGATSATSPCYRCRLAEPRLSRCPRRRT